MRELDKRVSEAKHDPQKLTELIQQYELFILRSAAMITKRHVSKNDDEWSIALAAFHDAIKNYSYDRGSFIAYAQLVIRRKLIDYYRSQNKYDLEVQVDWIEDSAVVDIDENSIKLEIEAIAQVLKSYGFSFMDLAECSPRAKKTKAACSKVAAYLLKNAVLMGELRNSKRLPLNIIEKNIKIPRKIIERHRKYIIAAIEILDGDYPYISEYLVSIREALKE